jgi:DNA segregation ATPase FtsK/SpoIIIE, S-DNA-T family
LTPVVTDPHKAITALAWCVREMEERYKRMAGLGVRTIDVFNNRVRNAKKRGERLGRTVQTGFDPVTGKATTAHEEMNLEPMPYIVIVIEEFSGLMAVAGREIEGSVKRLAEAARAVGIHLVMATERPTTDIVTGALKDNMPTRMAYKVASRTDSRVALGVEGAEQLLGAGDMLYATGAGLPVRLQGPYVSSAEVEIIADSLRQQGAPAYVEGLTRAPDDEHTHGGGSSGGAAGTAAHRATVLGSDDALYDRAVAIVVRDGRASAVHLGRRLNMAPAWAESLLTRLQSDGIVGAPGPDGVCILQAGIAA